MQDLAARPASDSPRWDVVRAEIAVPGLLALSGIACLAFPWPGSGVDFYAFWSFAKFVRTHVPAQIYDTAALHAFQASTGGYDVDLPFLYPPGILLPLWPLGLFSCGMAFALWLGLSLTVYLAALTQRDTWPLTVLAVLVAPATMVCVSLGQAGFLMAGLLIGGFRLVSRRPVLGGILLGSAALKPQLALLVPVALVAAGLWRGLLAAAASGLALVLLSSAAFGWTIWLAWATALPALLATIGGLRPALDPAMPTVTANLERLGADALSVHAAQVVAAGFAAWAVWRGFRAGPGWTATATLLVAGFLATPYALVGDLPLATGAVIILVGQRMRVGGTFSGAKVLILSAAFLLPLLMWVFHPFPFSAFVLALLLASIAAETGRAPHFRAVPVRAT